MKVKLILGVVFLASLGCATTEQSDYEKFQDGYEARFCDLAESCGLVCDISWDLRQTASNTCEEEDFQAAGVEACYAWLESVDDGPSCDTVEAFMTELPCGLYVWPTSCMGVP